MAGRHRILFVDDDPNFLGGIRRLLRNFPDQWDLTFAESVDQAVNIAHVEPPHVLVSHYQMPIKNRFDLVREMRAMPTVQEAPIIIVTGNTDEAAKRKALDLGATDLLNKPVNREDLTARIRSSLRLKQYQDNNSPGARLIGSGIMHQVARHASEKPLGVGFCAKKLLVQPQKL